MRNVWRWVPWMSIATACMGFSPVRPALAAEPCEAAREYITALNFLRDNKSLVVPEEEARRVADRVSEGCTGAANRFVDVTRVMLASGAMGKDALNQGLAFAGRTDSETKAFLTLFEEAYLPDYLDLDFASALKMAHSMTDEFDGDKENVRRDFGKLVEFCTGDSSLGLPKPQCGAFAARVARIASKWNESVSGRFIELFDFLRSDRGPHLIAGDALKVAEATLRISPAAAVSLVQGYRYATNAAGLGMAPPKALEFARTLAERSVRESEKPAER